ncbi:MAG: thioesterase family protein, partial [Pseudomonadota bacterium]
MPETSHRDSGAPLALHQEPVQSAWIDYNGHMNVAYYVLAFDHATDAFLQHFELGEKHVERLGVSTFVVEAHVNYLQEV